MTSSLVGSEMCIRDREHPEQTYINVLSGRGFTWLLGFRGKVPTNHHPAPVSYTHLTLPTICSV
eukprot:12827922-Prorocentrum_lima.AAC.1